MSLQRSILEEWNKLWTSVHPALYGAALIVKSVWKKVYTEIEWPD